MCESSIKCILMLHHGKRKKKDVKALEGKTWTSGCKKQEIRFQLLQRSCYNNQFSSVARSCQTLCDPMDRSTPGLPVHHQLQEPTQTHVHWVGDAIQPSHSLSLSAYMGDISKLALEDPLVSHLANSLVCQVDSLKNNDDNNGKSSEIQKNMV